MMPVELNNIQRTWQAFPVPFLSPLFSQSSGDCCADNTLGMIKTQQGKMF